MNQYPRNPTKMRRIPLLGVIPLLLAIAALTTAAAPAASIPVHPPRIRISHGTALNWSGYAVETNLTNPATGVVTDAKGSWVVPALSCSTTKTGYSAAWVGMDGDSDSTVEQTGTEQDCSSGKPTYYAWYEMYPSGTVVLSTSTYQVKAGDTINGEVAYAGGSQFTVRLQDVRNGTVQWSYSNTVTQSQTAERSSAEWIMEAPAIGSILPLADFGTIGYSGSQATISGHTGTITDSNWQYDAITMVTRNGTVKAQPSQPPSNGGSNFSVTWHHK